MKSMEEVKRRLERELDELMVSVEYMLKSVFHVELSDDVRKQLVYLALVNSSELVREAPHLLEPFLEDVPTSTVAEQFDSDLNQMSELAYAAEALKWLRSSEHSQSKRRLLLDIASCVCNEDLVRIALADDDIANAVTDMIGFTLSCGSASSICESIEKKSADGANGAALRQEHYDKLFAGALKLYDSMGLGKLSATSAAEQLRKNGVALSIDTLTRKIREHRKGRTEV